MRKPDPSEPIVPKGLVQVIIRTKEEERELWKATAADVGLSMAEWVRTACNKEVEARTRLLICEHPLEFRESYPWQETCTKCQTRLWSESI